MATPSYDEISAKAYQIWEGRGRPEGSDAAIWLEAERSFASSPAGHETAHAVASAPSVASHAIAPTAVEQKALVAEVQKKQARAAQVPHHTGPSAKPAETGKPVWPKARSA